MIAKKAPRTTALGVNSATWAASETNGLNSCAPFSVPTVRDAVCIPARSMGWARRMTRWRAWVRFFPRRKAPATQARGLYRTSPGGCQRAAPSYNDARAPAAGGPSRRPGRRGRSCTMRNDTWEPGRQLPGKPPSAPVPARHALLAPFAVLIAIAAPACGRGPAPESTRPGTKATPAVLETVGDTALVPLDAAGIENLTRAERAMAYYLMRATVAGRDLELEVPGDPDLEVRDLLEEILTHPRALDPEFRKSLLD